MPTQSLSSKINYRNARQFVEAVDSSEKSFYVFIGRPQAWPDEENPPTIDNTLSSEYAVWQDITAMKKVNPQDINLGFKRVNWVSGTIYTEYAHDVDLTASATANFYVFTDENKVYKCISNNRGAQSTIKPTHISTDIQTTGDGYKWKYMFNLSDSLIRKFAVSDYLPISSDATVIANATKGSVDHVKLISGGSGYTASATVLANTAIPVYIGGDGNRNTSARCMVSTSNGSITAITSITNGGINYPTPPELTTPVLLRQISTTGAIETAYGIATTNSLGEIVSVTKVIGGSGYVSGEVIIVASSCKGYAETNSSGIITNVGISTGYAGLNFRFATAVVVGTNTTAAVIKPIISPFNGHGSDPERELYARFVLVNLRIAYNEGDGDFTIQNDFRRIGLLEDPYNYGTTTIATANTLNAKRILTISNVAGTFLEDDVIYGQTSGSKGLHVDLFDTNKLRYIRDTEISNAIDFQLEPITAAGGLTATITSITNPEVQPYSGDILFINNRTAIDRSSDQIETVTLVLEY